MLRRTGGKYPLIRGSGDWHQPPGWWWDKDKAQWRPPSDPRREEATHDDLVGEHMQGLQNLRRPEFAHLRSWSAYRSRMQTAPLSRLVTTVAFLLVLDAVLVFWPNLAGRAAYLVIAGLITIAALLPLVARFQGGGDP
jgi:hypothetical protein